MQAQNYYFRNPVVKAIVWDRSITDAEVIEFCGNSKVTVHHRHSWQVELRAEDTTHPWSGGNEGSYIVKDPNGNVWVEDSDRFEQQYAIV